MSDLHAERILAYVAGLCTPTAAGCQSTHRNFPFTALTPNLPLLSINQVSDKPVSEDGPTTYIFNDWYLSVEFLVVVKSSTAPVDTAMNVIRAKIHTALYADYTQGGLCIDTRAGETTIEVTDGQKADEPVAVMHCLYDFQYRTKITDLTY